MRLKFRCLLTGCLLACAAACASNNTATSQPGSVTTSTNSTASQTVVTQPAAGSANEAGTPPSTANQPTAPAGIDACTLITTSEVAAIQGGAIKDTKANQRNDGDFLMSQCFYTAEEFVRSVSLSVVQPNPANPTRQPKDYFNEKFRDAGKKPEPEREKEREREKAKEQKGKGETQPERERGGEEEEKEGANVERVGGVGDQAYWVKSGPSAALYVLKNNQFMILSIGGGDAEPIKLKKTKALAQQALKRLK